MVVASCKAAAHYLRRVVALPRLVRARVRDRGEEPPESLAAVFGSVRFGSGSVRFGSVRFDHTLPFTGSVRFGFETTGFETTGFDRFGFDDRVRHPGLTTGFDLGPS